MLLNFLDKHDKSINCMLSSRRIGGMLCEWKGTVFVDFYELNKRVEPLVYYVQVNRKVEGMQ